MVPGIIGDHRPLPAAMLIGAPKWRFSVASKSKNPDNPARDKAALRAQEGAKATAQYEADAQAVREKTARLKALRLAKEAAESNAPAKAPAASKSRAKAKKPAAKSAQPLSDWLAGQSGSGRRS